MSDKLRKVIAIISLVFMGLFCVAITMTLADRNLLNGQIGYVALFTGFLGISLFIVLWLDTRLKKKSQGSENAPSDDGKTEQGSETETAEESGEQSQDAQGAETTSETSSEEEEAQDK